MKKAPDSSIFSGIELDLEDGHALGRKVHFRPYINRYNAQQKIFRHAYAKLPKEFSGLKFERICDFVADTFQVTRNLRNCWFRRHRRPWFH